MSYLVFARKYRPQTFADILGQEPIVVTLTNAIRQRRIGHAYLFAGPRGTGKTSTARIFAKALNCVEGPTATPCLTCDRCQEITQGRSLDVLEIDGASNRGIDQIRALRELAKFTPAAGAFKIYLIDEVHQITSEGFNALLKILEEPPSHVLFILATTAAHKMPPTILSRCQRYDFRRLPLETITTKIKGIVADEKLEISEDAVIRIARAAAGSLRDAESILDQATAYGGGKISGEDLQALLGTIDEDVFAEAMEALHAKDPVRLLNLVADATNEGSDLVHWTLSFLSFLRNLLVAKIGAGQLGFEDMGQEGIKRLRALSEQFSVEELTIISQILGAVLETMRRVGEPRIPLEMALIRLSTGESVMAVADLVRQLQAVEERLQAGGLPAASKLAPAKLSTVPAAASVPAAAPSAPPSSQSILLEQVVLGWSRLLDHVRRQKASTAAYLGEGRPVAMEGEPPQLVIGFPPGFEFQRDALEKPPSKPLIEQALKELLDYPVRCLFRMDPSAGATGFAAPAPAQQSHPSTPVAPVDPNLLNTVVDLFEGKVLPGSG